MPAGSEAAAARVPAAGNSGDAYDPTDARGGLTLWLRALAPAAPAGSMLRSLRVVAVAGECACRTLFVHAGATLRYKEGHSLLTLRTPAHTCSADEPLLIDFRLASLGAALPGSVTQGQWETA